MAPLLATLLKSGLSLAASAAAKKGVEYLKEKTGVEVALETSELTPEQATQIRQAELENEAEWREFQIESFKLEVDAAKSVNETMRAEAASEHWTQFSWRPSIGFSVAFLALCVSIVIVIAFGGVIIFAKSAEPLKYIPEMLTAAAAFIGVLLPILGVASWHRGKEKIERVIRGGRNA